MNCGKSGRIWVMSLFDPALRKPKSIKRPRIVYPKGVDKRLFATLYFASIVFWLLVFTAIAATISFLLLPIMGWQMKFVLQLVIVLVFGSIGAMMGMFIGSALVRAVIAEGIKEGDIQLTTNDER